MSETAELMMPQQSLLPTSKEELRNIVASEANYDRWSNFLFPHTKATGLDKKRSREVTFTTKNGDLITGVIEIRPDVDGRCFTTTTYDVLLALMKLWRNRKMPDDPINVTLREIARELDLKVNGRVTAMIADELRRLSRNTITWQFVFRTYDNETKTLEDQRILDTFRYTDKKNRLAGMDYEPFVLVRFSEHIRKNCRENVTIPVNLSARKSIRSSVAKCVYSRIDNILIKQRKQENTASYIVEHFELNKARYKHKSRRRELCEQIAKSLNGVETSRPGIFLKVTATETSNGDDWKCIFTTNSDEDLPDQAPKKLRLEVVNSEEDQQFLVQEMSRVVGAERENERLYQRLAMHYSMDHIHRAIGEYRELIQANPAIANKPAYFTSLMHSVAHRLGLEWIKACDANCKYRPENQLM